EELKKAVTEGIGENNDILLDDTKQTQLNTLKTQLQTETNQENVYNVFKDVVSIFDPDASTHDLYSPVEPTKTIREARKQKIVEIVGKTDLENDTKNIILRGFRSMTVGDDQFQSEWNEYVQKFINAKKDYEDDEKQLHDMKAELANMETGLQNLLNFLQTPKQVGSGSQSLPLSKKKKSMQHIGGNPNLPEETKKAISRYISQTRPTLEQNIKIASEKIKKYEHTPKKKRMGRNTRSNSTDDNNNRPN
ncbi:MAG: hypothetical protein ABEI52_03340, partial [Halobacteriaceae archaeon]